MSQAQALANLCDQCGHKWLPTVASPVHCPKCKSRKWNAKCLKPDVDKEKA